MLSSSAPTELAIRPGTSDGIFDRAKRRLQGFALRSGGQSYEPIVAQHGHYTSRVLGVELMVEGERLGFCCRPARVLDGIAGSQNDGADSSAELGRTLQRLAPRWFVVQNAHVSAGPVLLQPRWAMSLMRGPMTRTEIQRAREQRGAMERGETGVVVQRLDAGARNREAIGGLGRDS